MLFQARRNDFRNVCVCVVFGGGGGGWGDWWIGGALAAYSKYSKLRQNLTIG